MEIVTYAHQTFNKKTKNYHNSFIFVHDDTFGREFSDVIDIEHYISAYKLKCEVHPISKNKDGINVFLLTVESTESIDSAGELYDLHSVFIMLSDCKYYEANPCNFKPITPS